MHHTVLYCHPILFDGLHLQAVNAANTEAKQQMMIHYKNVPLLTAAASVPLGNIGSRIKIDAMIKTASAVCRPPEAGVILSCTCKSLLSHCTYTRWHSKWQP